MADLPTEGKEWRKAAEHCVCHSDDVDKMRALIGAAKDPVAQIHELDDYGRSLLHTACQARKGTAQALGVILEVKGLDLYVQGTHKTPKYGGYTPMYTACYAARAAAVAALLKAGVDPNKMGADVRGTNFTKRDVAVQAPPLVITCRKIGDPPSVGNAHDHQKDVMQVLKCLLDAGAEPNGTDELGFTALHCASNMAGQSPNHYAPVIEVINFLVERGADPTLFTFSDGIEDASNIALTSGVSDSADKSRFKVAQRLHELETEYWKKQPALTMPCKIQITAVRAAKLPAADSCGTSDPYLAVGLLCGPKAKSKIVAKSKQVKKNLNPDWKNEELNVTLSKDQLDTPGFAMLLQVWDKDTGLLNDDDFLGQIIVDLGSIRKLARTPEKERTVPLEERMEGDNKKFTKMGEDFMNERGFLTFKLKILS